jgi:hypothetical protein
MATGRRRKSGNPPASSSESSGSGVLGQLVPWALVAGLIYLMARNQTNNMGGNDFGVADPSSWG